MFFTRFHEVITEYSTYRTDAISYILHFEHFKLAASTQLEKKKVM